MRGCATSQGAMSGQAVQWCAAGGAERGATIANIWLARKMGGISGMARRRVGRNKWRRPACSSRAEVIECLCALILPVAFPHAALPVPPSCSPMADDISRPAVRAPDFPSGLEWINTDRALSLADLRGRAVLLDFWTYG